MSCLIDCYNKACVEDCSVYDDNGHGTHVAGIVAANGIIRGIAPDAKLIGVKILDLNGNGHITNAVSDLRNAINWCVQNRNSYNISVITMSLGTDELFNDYCDGEILSWTSAINNATLFNISIAVATGNDGNSSAAFPNKSRVNTQDGQR